MLLSLLAETSQIAANAIHFEDLGLRKGIDLGFFELRFYSLAYLAGIVLGYWHLTKMIKAPGSPLAQRHAGFASLEEYFDSYSIAGDRLQPLSVQTLKHEGLPLNAEALAWQAWQRLRCRAGCPEAEDQGCPGG